MSNCLEVYDLYYNRLCILNDFTGTTVTSIKEEYGFNTLDKITFSLPLSNDKWKFVINENLIKYKGEYYFIKLPHFSHTDGGLKVDVECNHLSMSLQAKIQPTIETIGATASELMESALMETGWTVGYVDTSDTRSLIASDQSAFTNLSKIAELYEGQLQFNSASKTVNLITVPIDRSIIIRKGKNLQSVDVSYDTNEMVTRMYVFGGTDPVSNLEVNIFDVNPQGFFSYIEDYSYYVSLGYSMEYISEHPELFLKEVHWNATDHLIAQELCDDAIVRLTALAKPKVTATVQGADLSQFPEHFTKTPIIGEVVYIFDEDLGMAMKAKVVKVSLDSENPMSMKIDISNEQEYKSIVQQLVDSSKTVNKVIDPLQQINGTYIRDLSVDNAKIKNLNADKINAGTIDANKINVVNLDAQNITAGYIKSDFLNAQEIKTALINTGIIVAGSGIIANSAIGSAQISDLHADKLTAGTINTSIIDIASPDGRMIIKDNSILTYDYIDNDLLQPFLRTQQGRIWDVVNGELVPKKDINGDYVYGFEVKNKSGQSTMIDGDGVHNEGIVEGAVNNFSVSPNANIDGAKLNIETVVNEINGNTTNINGSRIQLNDKTLDVSIFDIETTQTDINLAILNQTSTINQLKDKIELSVTREEFDGVKDDIVYKVEIISSNGGMFKNGEIATTLTAKVYKGATDITDTLNVSNFVWHKIKNDGVPDTIWDNAHVSMKSVDITRTDVNVRATFNCDILQ